MRVTLETSVWLYWALLLVNNAVTVVDSYQPRNPDGSIIYAPVPDYSDQYQLGERAADLRDTWILTPLVDMARKFSLTEVLKTLIPVIVLVGVGLLTAVLLPIVGCCFCCCRNCCGKCGAGMKVSEAQAQRKECAFLTAFLLIFTSVLLMVGAGSTYSVGRRIVMSTDMMEETLESGISDMEIFAEELFDGLNHVAINDTKRVFDAIFEDMDNVGQLVSEDMFKETESDSQTLFSNLMNIKNNVDELGLMMSNINDTTLSIVTGGKTLTVALYNVITDLNEQQSQCSNGQYPGLDCSTLPSSGDVPSIPEFSYLVPNLTSQQQVLNDAESVDWETTINSANDSLESVPNKITNGSSATINKVKNDLDIDTLLEPVNDPLNSVQDELHELLGNMTDIEDAIIREIKFVDKYILMGTNVLYGIAGAGFLILALCLLGMLLGTLGMKRKSVPERRTKASHCGGCCLFWSTGLSFAFGPFFFLLGSLLFAVGSQMTVVCRSVDDLTIFTEYIDKPGSLGEGYFLSGTLYSDQNIPLTVGGILLGCRANQAVYKTMQLSHLFNLTGLLDMESQRPDLNDLRNEVNSSIPSVEILNSSTNSTLTDIGNQDISFNVQEKTQELNEETDDIDLTGLITDLNEASNRLGSSHKNLSDLYHQLAIDVTTLDSTVLSSLRTNVASLQSPLHAIRIPLSEIKSGAAAILDAGNRIETYVNNVGKDVIIDAVSGVSDRIIGHGENHLANVERRLNNDLARCRIVWNVFDVINAGVCVFFLDAFNGLWASFCITATFLIPNIILTVKLAKYIRRPKDAAAYRRNHHSLAAMAQHEAAMEMSRILEQSNLEEYSMSIPPSAVRYSKL